MSGNGDQKETVRRGYDVIADRFLAWGAAVVGDPRERFVAMMAEGLAPGARILDLGCGAGIPTTQELADRFDVTGIDISAEQIARARRNVPAGTFTQGDLASADFASNSFDAIFALYSISHIPRREHADLFCRIAGWLTPGGRFLASLGARGSADWEGEWLGVPMFFSNWDAQTNRQLLIDAGLSIVQDEIVAITEPEGEADFLWIVANKPFASRGWTRDELYDRGEIGRQRRESSAS